MSTKKSALKQYLKYILQKTLLPIWYDSCRSKPIEEKLVLFADSNGDRPPESMLPLMAELEKRGYRCEAWCCDFSAAGFGGMLKFMRAFMKRYAVARGLVICNYFVPAHACRKRSETLAVQLWHSCGALKKFGYSTPDDIPPSYKGSVSRNIDLVTVSSPACVPVFEEAFRLKKGVAQALGVCRTDVFFDGEYAEKCRKKLHAASPKTVGKKILIYLPTFRSDASHAYTVGVEEVEGLKKALGEGWQVVIREHPRVKNGVCDLPLLSTNELLPCADMLITDYSSVIFEFSLLDKPMLLWCKDLEEYLSDRDFYLDFKRDMPCPVITDGEKLAAAVADELAHFEKGRYAEFVKKYMSACDGHSTECVADVFDK